MQRLSLPEDVAKAALFLASDDSSWVTGIQLTVYGGKVVMGSYHADAPRVRGLPKGRVGRAAAVQARAG